MDVVANSHVPSLPDPQPLLGSGDAEPIVTPCRIGDLPPFRAIVGAVGNGGLGHSLGARRRYWKALTLSMVAVSVLLVVGLPPFLSGGAQTLPVTTARHVVPNGSEGPTHEVGTWRLVNDRLSGTWQQNISGPPTGYLDCPAASVCYVMSGHYANADADARLLSASLYVTDDVGANWAQRPMPSGFAPTSSLACGGTTVCSVGGEYRGRPVFLSTTNGGRTFKIKQLPGGIGRLDALSCPSTLLCRGLAASKSVAKSEASTDSTFLSTNDAGRAFAERPIVTGLNCRPSRVQARSIEQLSEPTWTPARVRPTALLR